MEKNIVQILLLTLLLQSCISINKEELPDPCTPSEAGLSTLSLSYKGHVSGSISATGELSSSYYTGNEFAMAFTFSEYGNNWILIEAMNPTDGNTISFTFQDNGVGTASLSNGYGGVVIVTGEQYGLIAGSVTVTDYYCDRIKGTFGGNFEYPHIDSTNVVNVYDGAFDIKMIPH